MKIVLIDALRCQEPSQRAIPAIGLFYLKAYWEKYGSSKCQVEIKRTPREVLDAKPDIVGISSVTENMNIAKEWAKFFKRKLMVPILLGGDHITVLPHTLPEFIDIGVLGEGEETFKELLNLFLKNDNWHNKLEDLHGICYHNENEVVVNPRRKLITPMTRIPCPERPGNIWGNFHYCFTSRGCPYKCTFCSPRIIWQKYRTFPPNYVLRELDQIFSNFKPGYIHFFDDLFIGDLDRVKEISKLVKSRGYNKACTFGGHIRADMVTEDLCKTLVGMNFISGAFGAESGSNKILKFLKAGSTSVEMNQKAIDICYNTGLQLNLSFVIGTPGETGEDLDKTIKFIEKNRKKMQGIEVFILLPYPGTPLWTYAKRNNMVQDDMNWDLFHTKAYFSDIEITDDFIMLNQDMDREKFIKYVRAFQEIDREMNNRNFQIYEHIEKSIPEPLNLDQFQILP
ncbi:MAG: B12-binding domain-containing radical SAM protein [Vulcanimicrobiota bacterium]